MHLYSQSTRSVILVSDLKPHVHCSHIAAKTFGRCSVLLKGFISNDWLISDLKCIECVQRFFTRAICKRVGISEMSYADRLLNLGLQSLEYRRSQSVSYLINRCNDFRLFPPEMKTPTCSNLDILGSSIGDAQYCSTYILAVFCSFQPANGA